MQTRKLPAGGTAPTLRPQDLPLLSGQTFARLRNEIGDPAAFEEFVARYMDLWPHRYRRLVVALHDRDQETAMDAILSVRSSAQMLGALRLAAHALEIESAIRNRKPRPAKTMLAALDTCGQATMIHLRSLTDHDS